MRKLFIFDIDGTLMNDQREVLPATVTALQKAHDAGHIIGVVTGRSFNQLETLLHTLPFLDFVGTINGGIVSMIQTRQDYILATPVPTEVVKGMLKIAQTIKREFHATNAKNSYRFYFGNNPEIEVQDPKFFQIGNKDVVYQDFATCEDAIMHEEFFHVVVKCESDLCQQQLKLVQQSFGKNEAVDVVCSSGCCIECDAAGMGKDKAIKFIQQKYQIPNYYTYFFGDSGNDIKALDYVENGIAMGNAFETVKKHAKYIIGDHNSNAIHDFVMNIINYE